MTDTSTALVPIEEKSVEFYGDEVVAIAVQDGAQRRIYVPIKPLSDYLGLTWSGQFERIQRDEVLSEVSRGIRVTRIPAQGGTQEMLCLPIEYLHGWLFGIQASRVREALREKIIRYRRECYAVLWDAFQEQALAQQEPSTSTLGHIRSLGLAIAQLAEEQMEIEGRVTTAEERLNRAATVVGELGRRVSHLEQRLSPASRISDEQAATIAAEVKALAQFLTKHEPGNHFAGVYGELYRRFGVSSYKNIQQEQYEAVLMFLKEWRVRMGAE